MKETTEATKVSYAKQGRIARVHIHAGSPAFDAQTRRELNRALLQYKADSDAWMAVISAAGPDFAAGSSAPAPGSQQAQREVRTCG